MPRGGGYAGTRIGCASGDVVLGRKRGVVPGAMLELTRRGALEVRADHERVTGADGLVVLVGPTIASRELHGA